MFNAPLTSTRRCRLQHLESRFMLSGNSQHPANVSVVIVDDGDAGYHDSEWQVTSAYGYAGDARLGHPSYGPATWNFDDLTPGRYRILTTWRESSNRATDAVFEVLEGDEILASQQVNQRRPSEDQMVDGVNWEQLGIVELTTGRLTVALRPGTDGLTIADAVRLEPVNTLLPGPYLQTANSGLWSDPATWVGGRIPTATDDVLLQHDVTIDRAVARHVEIAAGTTTLSGNLDAYGSVIVRSKVVGNEGGILFHVKDDREFAGNVTPGPLSELPDFHIDDIGLWAMPGSVIDLEGEYVTPWLNAVAAGPTESLNWGVTASRAFGSGEATLAAAPVGWRPGDVLLLVNERGDHHLAELVTVSGVNVQYRLIGQDPDAADFVGNVVTAEGRSIHPKVANLSRRLQIISADVSEGDANHRAHTLFFGGSTANLANVELRDLGPREKLGRYPIHFHHGGASTSSLEGSSIWQDVSEEGNRFVALHEVQGVRVANNVGFASRGHGFFMEDGHEFYNEIVGNLSVNVTGPEELANVDGDVRETHHFWLRTGNTIEGNVAAGNGAVGLVILGSHAPDQATVVVNQEALGSKKYGIWTFAPHVTFENPVAAYAEQAGFAVDARWGRDSSGTAIVNPLFLFNGNNSPSYESQLFLNQAKGVDVQGGVIVGNKGIHTHYASDLQVTGTSINVTTLLTPTYWESEVVVSGAEIVAAHGFDLAYPIRAYAPGLVRIVDSVYQIDGLSTASPASVDFVGQAYKSLPGFEGEAAGNAWMLSAPAAHAGFVALPYDARTWRVVPVGQDIGSARVLYHGTIAVGKWQSLPTGYPLGLPPGDYAIGAFDSRGKSLGVAIVRVESGQIVEWPKTLVERSIYRPPVFAHALD